MKGAPVLAALLMFAAAAAADHMEISHTAYIYNLPDRNSGRVQPEPLEPGSLVDILPDAAQNGYNRISVPGTGVQGWVHRSRGRGITGPIPGTGPAPTPGGSAASAHLAIGTPVAVHERVRDGYVTAIDARLKIPAWVQYELRREDLDGPAVRGNRGFRPDRLLPEQARAVDSDYTNSGYARGHMAPAEDMTRTEERMADSFFLSNAAPQIGPTFNGAIWAQLEDKARDWASSRGRVTIITGPIFEPGAAPTTSDGTHPTGVVTYQVIGQGRIAVPTHFFKIIVDAGDPQNPEALAFIMPNSNLAGRRAEEFLVSVDEVERRTGLDFLSALPESVQRDAEESAASALWPS